MQLSEAVVAADEANEVAAELEAAQRRRRIRVGVALVVVGLAALIEAGWILRGWGASGRMTLGLAGVAVVWLGVQQLGEVLVGRDFQLGFWVAIAWVGVVLVLAVAAPILPIEGIDEPEVDGRLARPALVIDEPLGRDDFGRSQLSRVIDGARVSLTVGVVAAGLGMLAGGTLGLLAGYYRGRLDAVVGIVANAILAFPALVLLLALVAVLPRTVTNLAIGLAVLTVPTFIRLTRAQALVFAQREFVLAARAMGAKDRRIIFREILPNVLLPVASYTFLVMAVVIVAEGSLSYIGLGIPPPRPSWGGMIAKSQVYLKDHPHTVFVPAMAMFTTVLSLNRLGDWARKQVSRREAKI